MPKFVHLHNHSHYSLLDGLTKIDEMVDRAKELGMEAIALTDHGNLYGAIEFYKKAKKAGIKPILGVEAYLSPGSRFDKEASGVGSNGRLPYYHLILLAKNDIGWKNLIKLVTLAYFEGFYYKPRMDKELLTQYHEGLIALSACLTGEIPRHLTADKYDTAKQIALDYQELFGQGNFYLEIGAHPNIKETIKVHDGLIKLSKETGIPLVATQDIHYLKKDDAGYHDILLAIQTGNKLSDADRLSLKDDDFSMRSPEEMEKLFSAGDGSAFGGNDLTEAIENTARIAEACNVEIKFGDIHIPKFDVPDDKKPEEYLKQLVEERLANRFKERTTEISERINYELGVINSMGFADYFLIVQDFINWAKNYGIVVGPGRGSAAGSLISYILGITDIDPLKYDLLFERFLNPERIQMPDIDIDFTDKRRDEVLSYVKQKYGENNVAQIITFGTMAARAAIRDAGRALGMSYSFCDKIAKLIPFNPTQGMKMGWLKICLESVSELKAMYVEDPEAKRLLNAALKLEGVARHASVHACGVVISKEPLINLVPLQFSPQDDKAIITQFEMHTIEDLGLLKMDFLGLKNLSIIEETLRLIKELDDININISEIPLDDKKTYEFLQHGETTGIFQFECLSGETLVSNTTIKRLYEKKNKKTLHSVYLDEGKIHKNKLIDVIKSGIKDVYAVIMENNWYIKSTENHSFLTENGWKKLRDISPGEQILMKTKARHLVFNTCQLCENQISGQKEGKSDFCYTCSAKFYKNPSKNESREEMRHARARFFQNGGTTWNNGLTTENNALWKETAAKISKALVGRSLEDLHGKEKAQEMRLRMSKNSKRSNNPMFGKSPPHRNGGLRQDLGHYVRSNWEADFARILRLHNVEYQYEPETFQLTRASGEVMNYTPDFYVKSTNTYYEIKGWFHDLDKEKVALFEAQYPQFNFTLVNTTKFAELAMQYKDLVAWECPRIPVKNSFEFMSVKEIKYSGKEETFDIAMESPGNNFVASGFVVHNSSGMRRYMKDIKPTELEDLIALVSLYRPGPMDLIPTYIKRKHGEERITYLHPKLEPILKSTYGVGIYQEQMMRIARDLAGYTLAEADTLRKAIGKKIKSLLAEQQEKLVKGMIANGIQEKTANNIWELFPPFARYGFNRSHAACYALIGYQTAYLKAHYPVPYMTALLNADQNDTERIAFLVSEAKKINIAVLPPDINKSLRDFVPDGPNIRFGLLAVKNVGQNIVDAIAEERARGGSFQNFTDFLTRVDHKDLNKKSLESLIKCGAFDSLGTERNQALSNIEEILKFITNARRTKTQSSNSLFGTNITSASARLDLLPTSEATNKEKLLWEKELMGLYVSDHPLKQYAEKLKTSGTTSVRDAVQIKNDRLRFNVAGLISNIKRISTKTGQPMIFAKVEDMNDEMEIIVFSEALSRNPNLWRENNAVMITGKMSARNGEYKMICEGAVEL